MLDMLEKFGMTGCKPIATPIEQNAKLRSDVGEVLEDAFSLGSGAVSWSCKKQPTWHYLAQKQSIEAQQWLRKR